MTTSQLSNPTEIAQEPIAKRYFSQALVAITGLIIGLILGIFVTNLTTTATEVGMQPVAEQAAPTYSRGPTLAEYTAAIEENKASVQRAIEAEAARYTSLGMFYAAGNKADATRYSSYDVARNEANVHRGIETETARYSSMAKFYLTEGEVNTQRAIEAEAARYNGLADFYGAEDGANSLAWPPRPTQFHIAENAVMFLTENALAEYHQSEWGRIANVTLRIAENALAEYYQSEWGRTLSTVLPIAENGADADQDIGLMEFLAVPNKTNLQYSQPDTLFELHNK